MVVYGRPKTSRVVERLFWLEVRAGSSVAEAAVAVGVSRTVAKDWFRHGGGMPNLSLKEPSGRSLRFEDREEIMVGIAAGETDAQIARRIGRHPCTVSREL